MGKVMKIFRVLVVIALVRLCIIESKQVRAKKGHCDAKLRKGEKQRCPKKVTKTKLLKKTQTISPTDAPTDSPTDYPTDYPTTDSPTDSPTGSPTVSPTDSPTGSPTVSPTDSP